MFTQEERELMDALTGQMDAEDRRQFNQLSESDKKEFLRQAKRELEKEMGRQSESGRSQKGGFVTVEAPGNLGDFLNEHGKDGIVGALLAYYFLKNPKKGCGCLIFIIIAIGILMWLSNSGMI